MKMVGQCLLLVLFVLQYNFAGGEVITDRNAVLIKGFEASLQCSFRGTPLQLYWVKEEPLIGWSDGRTKRPEQDSGKFNVSEDCSLTFTADIGDAGRYYCDVSNDEGTKIGGFTDVTIAVSPVDPFPMIDNFTISDGYRPTTITCRADGASIGLVNLRWMHNGVEYPQIIRNFTNADGTTENLTATIEALVSEEPYICAGTLNATKLVNSTEEAFVQQTIFSTIPSEEPTEYLTTPIKDTDNNHWTVIAVAVSVSFLLVIAAAVCMCAKKKLPVRRYRIYTYKPCQKEESRQGNPDARSELCVTYVASAGKASIIRMTPKSNDLE